MENVQIEHYLDKMTKCYNECNLCDEGRDCFCEDRALREIFDYITDLEEKVLGIHN